MAQTRTEIQARYDAANRTTFSFKLHNTNDAEVIAKLRSVDSVNGYIRQLIKQDLAGCVPVSLSDAAIETLKEQANKTGKSVPGLIKLIVEEAIIRDYNQNQ